MVISFGSSEVAPKHSVDQHIGENPIKIARPERFELPTFWFVAVAARQTNNLAHVSRCFTKFADCAIGAGLGSAMLAS